MTIKYFVGWKIVVLSVREYEILYQQCSHECARMYGGMNIFRSIFDSNHQRYIHDDYFPIHSLTVSQWCVNDKMFVRIIANNSAKILFCWCCLQVQLWEEEKESFMVILKLICWPNKRPFIDFRPQHDYPNGHSRNAPFWRWRNFVGA